MLDNFNYHLHFEKDISECLKQQLSDKTTENQRYDVYKRRTMSDMGQGIKIIFFKCPSDHVEQLNL